MSEQSSANEAMQTLHPRKIILPILVSLGAVGYLFWSNDELRWDDVVRNVQNADPFWLALALFALFARDFGYIYRIRHITRQHFSWMSSFYVIMLWEFSSAITPSIVGGTTVAIFILNREGLSFGKAIAYTWLTALLDNLFFVFASLFVLVALPDSFPNLSLDMIGMEGEVPIKTIFLISAAIIFGYTMLMAVALFFTPRFFKYALVKITSIKWLRRWRRAAVESGNEILIASEELKGMTLAYWLRASLSTLFVWGARYFIINCLIASFSGVSLADHFFIFGRHVILWIVMLVSPTPGSSGIAEFVFPTFFGDFAGSFSLAVGVFWRLLTYYSYLIIGAVILPRWLGRVWPKKGAKKA